MHPKLVRYLTFPLHEKIIGRKTFSYLHELERLQWASPFQLAELQFEKLKVLLIHAGCNLFPKEGRDLIVKGFKKRMGKEIDVAIEMVDKIEKDASGKYRYVVSRVADKHNKSYLI